MKNCILVSTTNNKGFGLDSIKFLIDGTPYEYEVTGTMRHFIALKYNEGKRFEALNMAKDFGTLINRDLINEDSRIFSCDNEETLMKELDKTLFKHHGITRDLLGVDLDIP